MDSRKIIENAAGVYFSNEDLMEFLTIITPESEDLRVDLVQEIYKYSITPKIAEYLNEVGYDFIIDSPVSWCYEDYCIWCKRQSLEPKSKADFSRAIKELFDLESKVTTKDGIRVRVYRAV